MTKELESGKLHPMGEATSRKPLFRPWVVEASFKTWCYEGIFPVRIKKTGVLREFRTRGNDNGLH